MSIIYCEKHDRKWDSDKLDICPLCENEPMTASNSPKRVKDLEARLAAASAILEEMRDLWPLVRQLQDGCKTKIGESRWTEWDQSVIDQSVAVSFKLDGEPWVWRGEKHQINGGDAARTRAPENAHPEGGQNKSGQSVAESATAPPPITHRPLCPTCHGRRRIPFSGPVDCPECVGPLTPYGESELAYQREQASHFHKRMLEMKCALKWILQEAEFCRPDDAGPATTRIADRARKVLGNSMGEALARRESCI